MFPEHQQGKQPGLSIRLMLSLIQSMTKAQFLVILGPSVTAFTLAISFTPEAKVSAEGSGFSLGICHSEHQSWMHLRPLALEPIGGTTRDSLHQRLEGTRVKPSGDKLI